MFSSYINHLRKSLVLDNVQRQILVGSILGDGYLYPTVSGKYAYLRMSQGPTQEKYLYWKHKFFENWVLSPPKYQLQNKNKPELGGYFWFKTMAHSKLLKYREIFYKNREKIIPSNLGELLKSEMSLAIWYMDDGCIADHALHLNTQSFSFEENEFLVEILKSNFEIEARIHKSGGRGKGYILYIPKDSALKLMNLTNKYVKEGLPYKSKLL